LAKKTLVIANHTAVIRNVYCRWGYTGTGYPVFSTRISE